MEESRQLRGKLEEADVARTMSDEQTASKEQELQKALGRVKELEQVCCERDMLLEQEKASTTSLQQQINETKGAHSQV